MCPLPVLKRTCLQILFGFCARGTTCLRFLWSAGPCQSQKDHVDFPVDCQSVPNGGGGSQQICPICPFTATSCMQLGGALVVSSRPCMLLAGTISERPRPAKKPTSTEAAVTTISDMSISSQDNWASALKFKSLARCSWNENKRRKL